jgi:hypothetical protein
MASIRTAGLAKNFGDLRAVNEIDLDLPEGGVAGFVGPNTYENFQPVDSSDHQNNNGTARCDPGDRVLSGGFALNNRSDHVSSEKESIGSDPEGWNVFWTTSDGTGIAGGANVFTLCADTADPPH